MLRDSEGMRSIGSAIPLASLSDLGCHPLLMFCSRCVVLHGFFLSVRCIKRPTVDSNFVVALLRSYGRSLGLT